MLDQSPHPLERFLILAKSAKGAAATNLILQVIDAPNIYFFAELFSSANIAELERNSDYKPYFDLLQIFAYGLYSDYAKNASYFSKIPLNSHMIGKLRELTIVSLAKEKKRLPYVQLLKELALSNVRELEDLIIDAIYNNVIVGKLDQKNQTLEIESCAGRDVKIEELSRIKEILECFTERCHVMLSNMEQEMDTANRLKSETVQRRQKQEQEFENLKKTLKAANQSRMHQSSTAALTDTRRPVRRAP
uniref:PCI domain-containing protein n=1 Tax=Romanomermis culicivorax TaxID=13658 RepID=A0A915KDI4_ROMCU